MSNPIRFLDPDGTNSLTVCIRKGAEAGTPFGPKGQMVGAVVGGAIGLGLLLYNALSKDSPSQSTQSSSLKVIAGSTPAKPPNDPDEGTWRAQGPNLNSIDTNNLPHGWTKLVDRGGRIHIRDNFGNYRIRIDPARNGAPSHKHFYDINGRPIDINGNPTFFASPESHIPLR
jgi:hypothetical protein